MTVFNGLGSFFLKSCFNFEVTFLKSTTVVINGDDFTHFILKNIIGSEDDKHNEPLLFSVTASKLMSQLEMCEINPIFIFDSHTEPEYRWYSGGQTWYSIKRYKSSFMDVLSDFGMQYSTSFIQLNMMQLCYPYI
ncbi:unnamed protein product [Heterobilharzia americana]|nr:unnamed protein product [Heterobilharzia americana]